MLIRVKPGVGSHGREALIAALGVRGCVVRNVDGSLVVGAGAVDRALEELPGVAETMPIETPYKLVNRAVRPSGTTIRVGGVEIGGGEFVVAAGPCAVESEAQLERAAEVVARAGARILRGGAFKPRTSPYSFQGLEEPGLAMLERVGRRLGLPVVTEVLSGEDVPLVASYADVLQIGARNMQNFSLLRAVGQAGKPVLLKRGLSATVDELLLSAEYIALEGNLDIILCERGIRTFETATRNTLDLAGAMLLGERSHLPVLVDPSHGTGRRSLVAPLAAATAATGLAGLIVEVHPEPEEALCDGAQSVPGPDFGRLMEGVEEVLRATGRRVPEPSSGLVATTGIELENRRLALIDQMLSRLRADRSSTGLRIEQLRSKIGDEDGGDEMRDGDSWRRMTGKMPLPTP